MNFFKEIQVGLKNDIHNIIQIWKNILIDHYDGHLDLIYVKGSSCKAWNSLIDYVPILSDVDIHYRIKEPYVDSLEDFFSSIEISVQISKQFEDLFHKINPHYLHVPRVQILLVNKVEKDPKFIFPRDNQCQLIFGKWRENPLKEGEFIKKVDKERLTEDYTEILKIPGKLFDKSGLALWPLVRQISWRVSPTPYRLLTQLCTNIDPIDIWGWNRSEIVKQLKFLNCNIIANQYKLYYETGWENFKSNFSNSNLLRKQIVLGYEIVRKAFEKVEN